MNPPSIPDQQLPGDKSSVLAAFRRLMRPLVKMLIRQGVAFGEFAEVLKQVYVEVASDHYALPNKKISGSRIAILTGLTRKDVKRIVDFLNDSEGDTTVAPAPNLNRATRVLSGWHQDPDFTGPYGFPVDLPFEGSPSFSELVKRYSGDMPARAMLEELQRVGAVARQDDGCFRVLTRYYIATRSPMEAQYLGDVLHDLASTIEFNFDPERNELSPKRFERWVATDKVDPAAMEDFRDIVKEGGSRFLERLDTWLSLHEITSSDDTDASPTRTRVGVYFYEDSNPKTSGKED
ncbi:MAG: DUF6502 family protein [Pseudomonadota bacterium]